MADTTINIYLHDSDNSNVTSPKDPGTTPKPNNPTENKGEQGQGNRVSTMAIGAYIGKQALSMASSRVGQVTHSSLMQQKTNAFNKMIVYGIAIAKNPIMGTLALTTDLISSQLDYSYNVKQEQNGMSVINARAGNSVNRSRE